MDLLSCHFQLKFLTVQELFSVKLTRIWAFLTVFFFFFFLIYSGSCGSQSRIQSPQAFLHSGYPHKQLSSFPGLPAVPQPFIHKRRAGGVLEGVRKACLRGPSSKSGKFTPGFTQIAV